MDTSLTLQQKQYNIQIASLVMSVILLVTLIRSRN